MPSSPAAHASQAPAGEPQPTVTLAPSPTSTPFLAMTQVVLPSATPVTYSVVKGDTLSSIALKYGIPIDVLQEANPGVSPNSISVGTVLVVPVGGVVADQPTPTPMPLVIRQTACHPTAEGGLWCLALVEDGSASEVENLSLLFSLIGPDGDELSNQVAFSPLNLLPPGSSMPVGIFFPAPVPQGAKASVQLLSANRVLPGDLRYLSVGLQNVLVQVDWNGLSARVSGVVALLEPDKTAATTWILAVAYDRHGNLVGFKRLDLSTPLASADPQEFDLMVSSLGLEIDSVALLVEARP